MSESRHDETEIWAETSTVVVGHRLVQSGAMASRVHVSEPLVAFQNSYLEELSPLTCWGNHLLESRGKPVLPIIMK